MRKQVKNNLVVAYQWYDGMSAAYKKNKKPYNTVVGLVVDCNLKGWSQYVDVMDANGKVHHFSSNFNFDILRYSDNTYTQANVNNLTQSLRGLAKTKKAQ